VDERAMADLLEGLADVSLAYLVGSVARGEARRRSDLDLALLFTERPTPNASPRSPSRWNGPPGDRRISSC
jgi:predicted nucleotidyltransferase